MESMSLVDCFDSFFRGTELPFQILLFLMPWCFSLLLLKKIDSAVVVVVSSGSLILSLAIGILAFDSALQAFFWLDVLFLIFGICGWVFWWLHKRAMAVE
jgi:hypothetical protein